MTLYELLVQTDRDYDVFDNKVSRCITMTVPDLEDTDAYNQFCIELAKCVTVVGKVHGCEVQANWSTLIGTNWNSFKEFTASYWSRDYEDKDKFVFQWIKELNLYVAGYVSEEFYGTLVDFVRDLQHV